MKSKIITIIASTLLLLTFTSCENKSKSELIDNPQEKESSSLVIYEADEYGNSSEDFIDQYGIRYKRTSTKEVKATNFPTDDNSAIFKFPDLINVNGKEYCVTAVVLEYSTYSSHATLYFSNSIKKLSMPDEFRGTIHLTDNINIAASTLPSLYATIYSPHKNPEELIKAKTFIFPMIETHNIIDNTDHYWQCQFSDFIDPISGYLTLYKLFDDRVQLYVPAGYSDIYKSAYIKEFDDRLFNNTRIGNVSEVVYKNKIYYTKEEIKQLSQSIPNSIKWESMILIKEY